MAIKVNTYQLQSKAAYAGTLTVQLETAGHQLNGLYANLDSRVKSRQGIGSNMKNLERRIEKSRQKMYNISKYLTKAAEEYNAAEAAVEALSARLGGINAMGAASIGWTSTGVHTGTGAAVGKVEGKKLLDSNWKKIAIGVGVIGVAIGVAILAAPIAAVAAIATAAATGAAIGALAGGITAGIVSTWHGNKFMDGFANGFMWGSIGGAVSGIVSGSVAAAVGTKAAVAVVGKAAAKWIGIGAGSLLEGFTNAGLYAAQTRYEGGQITATGLAVSFIVAAGFSAVGGILSGVGKGTKEAAEEASNDIATKTASEVVENGNIENKVIQGLDEGSKTLDDVAKAVKDGTATTKILKETDKYTEYLNDAGEKIRIPKQASNTIEDSIIKNLDSLNVGSKTEAEVANYIKNNTGAEITDYSNKVKNSSGQVIGDIDCATANELIEVKKSISSVKVEQFDKYVDSTNPNYLNVDNKKVILFVEEYIDMTNPSNLAKITELQEKGVSIVNGLDKLKGVIE